MKEHVQKPGVRKWAGEDLIELQGESLTAIQALVEPYAPCIIQGCEVSQANGVYQVQPGIVALKGSNEDGNACKIVRFEGYTGAVMPIYLTIKVTPYMRVYADEENKPIAYEYTAESSTTQPSVPYLKIDTTGGERLVDTIGITQKLDRDGGNASNVKVMSFVSSNDRSNIEAGSSLKELFGKIRRWFNDLGKLAFKNTVGKSDFDTTLTEAFNNKVDKDGDKVLSECDFKKSYEDKLNGIAEKAQVNVKANWSETNAESDAFIQNKPTISSLLHSANPGNLNPTDDAIIVISGNNGTDKTTYYKKPLSLLWNWIKSKLKTVATSGSYNDLTDKPDAATQSAAGFMSAEDKTKLDNIAAGANNYTHPTTAGNKHIPSGGSSGQYLKRGTSSGTAVWATPTASEVGALPTTGGTINGSLNVTGQLKENGYRVYSYKNKPGIDSIYNVIFGHVTSKGVVTCSSDQKVECTLYNTNGVCYLQTDGFCNGVISVVNTENSNIPSSIDKTFVIDEYIRFRIKFDGGPVDFDFIIFLWGEY